MDDMNKLCLSIDHADDSDYFARANIACCGHYLECSDAGCCVNKNTELSNACLYKDTLVSGMCYYGKKATGFDQHKYEKILNEIGALSPSTKQLLCQIAHFYFIESYLSSDVLVYNTKELNELVSLHFFVTYRNDAKVVSMFKLKELRDRSGLSSSEFKTRDKLLAELMKNQRDLLHVITSQYIYLDFIIAENRKYFIEAYHDGYFPFDGLSPLPLPAKIDERFLKSKQNQS
jgi:hypothetical protein